MLKRSFFVAALLATSLFVISPAFAATGPAGIWKLNEGSGTRVADSSGNGNNGLLSGDVSWSSGVFGGSGLSFGGSDGEVKVADNLALEPATSVTVSAWFRGGSSPGAFRYIAAKGANGCIAASYGLYSGPDGGLEFYISQQHGSVYARSPDAGGGVWNGTWHLAVGTYDGATIRLYVDGTEVGSGTSYPGALEYLLPNSNDFYIGNYPGCTDHDFAGGIDDVMVWGRTLSQGEIQSLVSGGGPTTPTGPTSPTGGNGNGGGSGTGGNGGSSGGGSTSGKTGDTPSIRDVKLSNGTLRVNSGGHAVSSAGSKGLSLSYTESQPAKLTVTLLRSESGVRRGSRCVPPPRKAKHVVRCSRFVVISSFVRTDRQGQLTVSLGHLLNRRLSPGTYRLDVTPQAQGKVGKTVSVRLLVRRSSAHR
jgi:hypothetical protein